MANVAYEKQFIRLTDFFCESESFCGYGKGKSYNKSDSSFVFDSYQILRQVRK